ERAAWVYLYGADAQFRDSMVEKDTYGLWKATTTALTVKPRDPTAQQKGLISWLKELFSIPNVLWSLPEAMVAPLLQGRPAAGAIEVHGKGIVDLMLQCVELARERQDPPDGDHLQVFRVVSARPEDKELVRLPHLPIEKHTVRIALFGRVSGLIASKLEFQMFGCFDLQLWGLAQVVALRMWTAKIWDPRFALPEHIVSEIGAGDSLVPEVLYGDDARPA
ncbi:unnamed protein product, partial [Prorocentrum cordatum]